MDGPAGAMQALSAMFNTMAGGRYNATCLTQINGGNPGQIHSFAGDLTSLLGTLSSLLGQLQQQKSQLTQVWTSAQSAPAAMAKLASAFSTFQHTIEAVDRFIKALHGVADQLNKAMSGANTAVQQHDPLIGQLLANPQPGSQALARVCAVNMDSGVMGFLMGQSGALTGTAGTITSGTSGPLGTIMQAITTALNTSTAAQPATALPVMAAPLPSTLDPVAPVTTTPVTTTPVTTTPVTTTPVATTPVPMTPQSYPYGYPTDSTPTHHVEVDFGPDGSLVAVKADIDAEVDVQRRAADGTTVEQVVHVRADGTTTTTTA